MKRIIILLPAAFLVLNACKNDPNEVNKAKSIVDDIEKTITPTDLRALKDKVPLNKQELEDTFPSKMGDHDRTYINVSEEMGTAKGTFNDGRITLSITDAAGPMGSQLITMFNALYDLEETNDASEKTIRNKQKIIEVFNKDTNESSIEFIYVNRFHILLTAKGMTPDELWQLFEFDNHISSLLVLNDFDKKNTDRNQ